MAESKIYTPNFRCPKAQPSKKKRKLSPTPKKEKKSVFFK
jgi:hypothetical protein